MPSGIIGLNKIKAPNTEYLLKNAREYFDNKFSRLITLAANSTREGDYIIITKGLHYSNDKLHFDCRVILNNSSQHSSDLHVFVNVIAVPFKEFVKVSENGSVKILDECSFSPQLYITDVIGY